MPEKATQALVEEIKKHCDSHIEYHNNVIEVLGLEGECAVFDILGHTGNKIIFKLMLHTNRGPNTISQIIFYRTTLATHQFVRLVAAADVAYIPVFKAMLKLKAFNDAFRI